MSSYRPEHEVFHNRMETAFSTLLSQFPNSEEKIRTKEFLDASSALMSLVIGQFGEIFLCIMGDMTMQLKSLFDKYSEDEEQHEYLEDMVLKEQIIGEVVASESLICLKRRLHFVNVFFDFMLTDLTNGTPGQNLTAHVVKAYGTTLQYSQGPISEQYFRSVGSHFLPDRIHLMSIFALEKEEQDTEQIIVDMRRYNEKMGRCVKRLSQFSEEYHLDHLSIAQSHNL